MAKFSKNAKSTILAPFCTLFEKTEFSLKICSDQSFFLLFSIRTQYYCVEFQQKTTKRIPSHTGFRWTHGRTSMNLKDSSR